MSKDNNLEHELLDLRPGGHSDQTFLGNLRLAARTRLFLLTGLLAMAAFAALFSIIDKRMTAAVDEFAGAEKMVVLAAAVETGIAGARGEEKKFLLQKDPVIAESFNLHLESVSEALGRLSGMAKSVTLRKPIDTIRDGLAQYDQQFSKLVKSEKALGLTDGTGLSREIQNATEELQVKFSTAGYANLAGQVSRINQEGQETLLSGYKKGVGEIQKRYQTLIVFLKETKIPTQRKKLLQELLQKHETILLAMINSRFAFEDEAQRVHVAVRPHAGVTEQVPGAADVVALLQNHKVVKTGLFQLDGHAQAGKTGADNGDLGGLFHCCTPVWPEGPCLLLSVWSS